MLMNEYSKQSYISNKINSYYKNKYKRNNIKQNIIKNHKQNRYKGGFNRIYTALIKYKLLYSYNRMIF